MKLSNQIQLCNENKSLDKQVDATNNGVLSQKLIAVKPNCSNWLFLRPNTAQSGTGAGVNPSYICFTSTKPSSYDGVILQNKPIGEYAERFLLVPRVDPITLLKGCFSNSKT